MVIVLLSALKREGSALDILFHFSALLNTAIAYPASGNRNNSNGTLNNVGSNGNYWTSTPNANNPTNGSNLNFNSNNVNPANNNNRANGNSVSRQKET